MPHVRAPGRVNLIGDHTDYQEGFCLPIAIDREVRVEYTARDDGVVTVASEQIAGTVTLAADGSVAPHTVEPEWGRVPAAVLEVLGERGRASVGFDASLVSTVPVGSGLSSSAAVGVALTHVAAEVAELQVPPREIALVAQEVEHRASGVPCGVMDQLASECGRAGHALLIDCRSLDIEAVPLPLTVAIVVVHSGLPRRLASSEYAHRRTACESLARMIGVRSLRDASPAQVADDPFGRHVVSENARVLAFVDALAARELEHAGALMVESHASLRDDFDVSTPELDLLVALALELGAFGARLTGAGFGGCIVALVPVATADAFGTVIAGRYRSATGHAPVVFPVRAVDGAST